MGQTRSLAAAQTIPVRGDVDANVERHTRLVCVAAELDAQILVFPELSLTGYELDLADDLAFSEEDARLDPLVEMASAHRMTLVVGAPVRTGAGLHIGAFIVSPGGGVELYTKQHLGTGEENLQPGDRNPLVQLGRGPAAVAVCADANHASHPKDAAARGASSYLVSTFIAPTDLEKKTASLSGYAARHSMVVVFANYGGPSGGLASGGASAIWSESGELLAQLDGIGAGVVAAAQSDGSWSATTTMFQG